MSPFTNRRTWLANINYVNKQKTIHVRKFRNKKEIDKLGLTNGTKPSQK